MVRRLAILVGLGILVSAAWFLLPRWESRFLCTRCGVIREESRFGPVAYRRTESASEYHTWFLAHFPACTAHDFMLAGCGNRVRLWGRWTERCAASPEYDGIFHWLPKLQEPAFAIQLADAIQKVWPQERVRMLASTTPFNARMHPGAHGSCVAISGRRCCVNHGYPSLHLMPVDGHGDDFIVWWRAHPEWHRVLCPAWQDDRS